MRYFLELFVLTGITGGSRLLKEAEEQSQNREPKGWWGGTELKKNQPAKNHRDFSNYICSLATGCVWRPGGRMHFRKPQCQAECKYHFLKHIFLLIPPQRNTTLINEIELQIWKAEREKKLMKILSFFNIWGKSVVLGTWRSTTVGTFLFCFSNQSMAIFSEATVHALGKKCKVSFTCQLYYDVCHSSQYRTIALFYFLSLL